MKSSGLTARADPTTAVRVRKLRRVLLERGRIPASLSTNLSVVDRSSTRSSVGLGGSDGGAASDVRALMELRPTLPRHGTLTSTPRLAASMVEHHRGAEDPGAVRLGSGRR